MTGHKFIEISITNNVFDYHFLSKIKIVTTFLIISRKVNDIFITFARIQILVGPEIHHLET